MKTSLPFVTKLYKVNHRRSLRISGSPVAVIAALILMVIAGVVTGRFPATARATASTGGQHVTRPAVVNLPRPDHIVIAVEENHAYSEIIGSPSAPYINSLAQTGALFTQSYAIEHPSQPNYLDLFSGSNQGVTDDSCPHTFSTANLGSELLAAGLSFVGYSESLPSPGSTTCSSGPYVRKHAPWVNFTNVPASSNLPFSSFPSDFTTLPAISFVIPNLDNDMHNGTIGQGDTWLQQHLGAYEQWARTHNSLFIVTFDEDDQSQSNRIATIFVGANVVSGQYSETINHFNVLRTLEDMYGLPYAGVSGNYQPIADVWSGAATPTPTHVGLTPTSTPTGPVPTATGTPLPGTGTATPTVTGTPSGCTVTFNDVPPGSPFYPYIQNLACRGLVAGYSDGTFRPGANVTRGQISKIVANSAGFNEPVSGQHFQDVPPTSPFYLYIERMSQRNIISGYNCGGVGEPCVPPANLPYFRPNANATRGQISKIVVNTAVITLGWTLQNPPTPTFQDVGTTTPFYQYIETAYSHGVLSGYTCGGPGEPCVPPGNKPYFRTNNNATRGQASKIDSITFFPQP